MVVAHPVSPVNDLALHWHLHVPVLALIVVAGGLYLLGLRAGQRARPPGVEPWRVLSFSLGLGVLVVALTSPIDSLASSLFYVHMVQHLLVLLVAPPLLVWGRPARVWQRALLSTWAGVAAARAAKTWGSGGVVRLGGRAPTKAIDGESLAGQSGGRPGSAAGAAGKKWGTAAKLVTSLAVVWALNTLVTWAWHFPSLYEAALRADLVHALEHGSFLAISVLFWAVVLGATGGGLAGRVFLVFATALQSAALGAVIAFADSPLYSADVLGAPGWGLTPLEDQQLAGALMWVLPGILYLVVMVALLFVWFRGMESLSPASARDR